MEPVRRPIRPHLCLAAHRRAFQHELCHVGRFLVHDAIVAVAHQARLVCPPLERKDHVWPRRCSPCWWHLLARRGGSRSELAMIDAALQRRCPWAAAFAFEGITSLLVMPGRRRGNGPCNI